MSELTTGDFEAILDVLRQIGEESDQLPTSTAIAYRGQLERVSAELRRAQSLVDTQLLQLLEQPFVVDGHRYTNSPKRVRRFDHDRLARMIIGMARIDRETGEIRDVDEALAVAAHLFLKIYTSRSTEAKSTEIKSRLGVGDLEEENLAFYETTGRTIKVYDLEEED